MRVVAVFVAAGLAAAWLCAVAVAQEESSYVGSAVCSDCHFEEYENYSKYAKKAHSSHSIKIMASDLTEEEIKGCFGCHTTGYGKPGGFVSFEETPDLANSGCEVCHGPGSLHVEYGGDLDYIDHDLDIEMCTSCHNEERVGAFNFKPMLFGGAH